MVSLFFKAVLGAAAVVVIALLSRSRNFFIAGLVPLFPTFALIAHYIVGSTRSRADLRTTALFGLCALVPYAAYLLAVYVGSARLGLLANLSVATLVWLLGAGLLLVLWLRFYPGG